MYKALGVIETILKVIACLPLAVAVAGVYEMFQRPVLVPLVMVIDGAYVVASLTSSVILFAFGELLELMVQIAEDIREINERS